MIRLLNHAVFWMEYGKSSILKSRHLILLKWATSPERKHAYSFQFHPSRGIQTSKIHSLPLAGPTVHCTPSTSVCYSRLEADRKENQQSNLFSFPAGPLLPRLAPEWISKPHPKDLKVRLLLTTKKRTQPPEHCPSQQNRPPKFWAHHWKAFWTPRGSLSSPQNCLSTWCELQTFSHVKWDLPINLVLGEGRHLSRFTGHAYLSFSCKKSYLISLDFLVSRMPPEKLRSSLDSWRMKKELWAVKITKTGRKAIPEFFRGVLP